MKERVEKSKIRVQIQYDNEIDEVLYILKKVFIARLQEFLMLQGAENTLAPNLMQMTILSISELSIKNPIEAIAEVQIGNLRKQTKVINNDCV